VPTLPSCPICGREAQPRFRPFCSQRCAEIDLGRWLTGRYALPGEEEAEIPPPGLDRPDTLG
jgi:endogenous inhibitor of DNA gyrase (YacG/DUF329 family)